ncbi:DUF6473 family protein [Pseudaestuariivita sp.]|uniref:DUF6473 family protein n=1 Tax=Pseudaestuariivita sp. TaxID=2211669 RepID=UPI0040589FFA
MTFERSSLGALDYAPCRYGASMVPVRGPKQTISPESVACLGSTDTFGKFVPEPFPQLVQDLVGVPCVNLGADNAGVDTFLQDPALIEAANAAGCRVVQVMCAHNLNNPFYTVHPRRNDRFIAPTEALTALYPEVDFTEHHFTRAMLLRLRQVSRKRFETVVLALKGAWEEAMIALMERLEPPVLLTWISDTTPPEPGDHRMRRAPLFVDVDMMARVAPEPPIVIRVSAAALATNTRGMIFGPMQAQMAAELLGPSAHVEVAMTLSREVETMIWT